MSRLPQVMPFECVDGIRTLDCYWEKIGFAVPRRGDWYVSGTIPMAYRASKELCSSYLCVRPTHFAKLVQRHERGDKVAIRTKT